MDTPKQLMGRDDEIDQLPMEVIDPDDYEEEDRPIECPRCGNEIWPEEWAIGRGCCVECAMIADGHEFDGWGDWPH